MSPHSAHRRHSAHAGGGGGRGRREDRNSMESRVEWVRNVCYDSVRFVTEVHLCVCVFAVSPRAAQASLGDQTEMAFGRLAHWGKGSTGHKTHGMGVGA